MMTDFSTERLEPAGRVAALDQQDRQEQGPGSRRRPPWPLPSKQEPELEEVPDEPSHQLDHMA
jgi:hypothetical protein